MKRLLSTILLIAFAIGSILAAPLKNVPYTITQPNGQVIHCFVSGDEFFNYCHDAEGYTIIMNKETGYYTYAVKVNDEVVPSEYIVGQVNPSTVAALVPGVKESAEKTMAKRIERMRQIRDNDPAPHTREQNHGRMNNLVVFISFQNDTVFPKTYSQVYAMFNDTSSASSMSLKNFYSHVSYDQFTIQSYLYPQAGPNDVILSYHDSHSENFYRPYSAQNPEGYLDADGKREREFSLLANAIEHVRSLIPASLNLDYNNDGKVDNVVFIVNCGVGNWNDLLWPHRWSIFDRTVFLHGKRVYDFNLIMGDDDYYFDIGTLCHEMFHSLGAPDLYSYSYGFSYVGSWDLMEGTTNPPQNMGAYMKQKYGTWMEIPEAHDNGVYTLYPVSTSPNCAYKIYPDREHNPHQYLVIEYRDKNSLFDGTVYGSGAVIYRINDQFNGNAGADYTSEYPEVYAFRRGAHPVSGSAGPTEGNFNQSYFGGFNMTEFTEYTNPYPFYCNGTSIKGLRIVNIKNYGDSLQFHLIRGEVTIDTFPWREPFESDNIPYYCHHEYTTNYSVWTTHTGNQAGTIAAAHTGSKNALFYSITNSSTKLVMPVFDFSFLQNPVLSFWCAQAGSSNYNLKVYYKTSSSDEWTLLQTYTSFTADWTQQTLNLPSPSATYQIAFEATGSNGSGLVLDDIQITGTPITEFVISASAGEHGQISPSGDITVPLHGTQTFDMIPEQGYTVDQLLIDGVSQQRTLHYTFDDVVASHTISATFRTANPSLNASPASLFFSAAGGDTSIAKSVNVIANDLVEDIHVQMYGPFLGSLDQETYSDHVVLPYNGGRVYVVFAPRFGGAYQGTMHIVGESLEKTVTLSGSATGIEEQHVEEIQLFPNPTGDRLNLVFAATNLPEKVEIIDLTGRTVMIQKVTDGNVVINVESLNAGVYFVRADNIVKKFIKK